MNLIIQHQVEAHQFIAEQNGKISRLAYSANEDEKVLDFYSTFVPPELRGSGIAAQIVKEALAYAKENHYKIKPSCSYVADYIRRHSEYQILIKE